MPPEIASDFTPPVEWPTIIISCKSSALIRSARSYEEEGAAQDLFFKTIVFDA
jgi:hypothetical protein